MSIRTWLYRSLFLIPLFLGAFTLLGEFPGARLLASVFPRRFLGPTQSGPIAVTTDDRFVWVANPDNDLVTLIGVEQDSNRVLARVPVGDEPQNVAVSPDNRYVYVSNTASGTVSVIRARGGRPRVVETIRVGTEPYGMAFTPNGDKLYVANARSNNVSVIDGKSNRVVDTIDDVGLEPRGVAVTNDGDRDDDDEKVYVTQFFGVDRPGVTIGRDDYKEGRVTVISTATDRVIGQVVLNPITDTGFKSNGSAINRVPATNPATFFFTTAASPNMLNSVAIKGTRAYLPNTAASADGPVRFNVNVQALLSVIDVSTDTEAQSQTINMNRGINFEPAGPTKLFLGVPWTIAFKHDSNEGYVVAAAANIVVKVDLDNTGTPTINAPTGAGQPSGIIRIVVGQNPRGIAINGRDDRAYVMNEVSRDVSVIDLTTNQVMATVPTADLPAAGTEEAKVVIGKGIFNSSTGVSLPQLGPEGVIGQRLSSEGWSGCFSCHPFGLTDGVVWIFASGPRRTLPLNGTFNPHDPTDIKILNHSAIFDEIQDFELNIRTVSGNVQSAAQGLIPPEGLPDPDVTAFGRPNAGRSIPLDDLALFVAKGIRTPISPFSSSSLARAHGDDMVAPADDGGMSTGAGGGGGGAPANGGGMATANSADLSIERDNRRGRRLFAGANCASCHGGAGWASSRRGYIPSTTTPSTTETITDGQIVRFLKQVGTFNPSDSNEIRAAGVNVAARGAAGFNPPSLLGAFALGPYLHNGSALTLADVMENVTHRSAGTGGLDLLADPRDRRQLVRFLQSIDASTEPFPLGTPGTIGQAEAAGALLAVAPEFKLDLTGANPVRSHAELAYSLPGWGRVELALFDVQGRHVTTLAKGMKPAGRYRASWDGRRNDGTAARPGIYFARLKTPAGLRVRKIVWEK